MTTHVKRTMLAALLLALTAGCGSADEPGYEPKPEAELVAAVKALPRVTTVNLTSFDGATEGTGYNGQISVDTSANPVDVLDRTLAILWQGIPDADYSSVRVIQDTHATRPADVGLIRRADFEARYGQQPGTGVPPTDKPALELVG